MRQMRMLYIGPRVPKALLADGWREVSGGIHLGLGLWILPLEKLSEREQP